MTEQLTGPIADALDWLASWPRPEFVLAGGLLVVVSSVALVVAIVVTVRRREQGSRLLQQVYLLSYWLRPFDMHANARRWRWQRPSSCCGIPIELHDAVTAAVREHLRQREQDRLRGGLEVRGGQRLAPGAKLPPMPTRPPQAPRRPR